MVTTIVLTRQQLTTERDALLEQLGDTLADLRDRADRYAGLTEREWAHLHRLDTLEFLLS